MSVNIKRLIRADEKIQKIVQEFGLDCYPQEFDVIPARKMLEIMAYHLPVNYSHWSFGRDFEKQRTRYEYTGGIPYEVVLNSNPSRAFLMNTNPYPIQVLVMAHVYGHNDFMKNNIYFSPTRRDMLTSSSEAAARFRKYEESYGIDEVERFIDACQSIQWNVDADFFIEENKEEENQPPDALTGPRPGSVASQFSDLFDYDNAKKAKSFDERRKESREEKKRFPSEPEVDLMRFIMQHSPRGFEAWEQDILSVIREQARYFMPQRRTKVMNEGWASFWHMRIMSRLFQEGFLTEEEHGFYNLYNSRVIAANPYGLNPYLLGIKTFFDIEDRWNKGQFGTEWEKSEDPGKWDMDKQSGKGLDKIFEVRRTYMDWFFLDEFLNQKVCEEAQLYIYAIKNQGQVEDFVVEEKNWRVVKDLIVRSFAHSGTPLIKVLDGDYGGKRELYLKHFYEGLTLEEEHCHETMRQVQYLWDRPVHLETVEVEGNREIKILITFDGREFSRISLGAFKT